MTDKKQYLSEAAKIIRENCTTYGPDHAVADWLQTVSDRMPSKAWTGGDKAMVVAEGYVRMLTKEGKIA